MKISIQSESICLTSSPYPHWVNQHIYSPRHLPKTSNKSVQLTGEVKQWRPPYSLFSPCWSWISYPSMNLTCSSRMNFSKWLKWLPSPLNHVGFIHTWDNFIPPDVDVIISVTSGLLMVKSQSMQDLMFNDGLIVTALANGKVLSPMKVANIRPAPLKRSGKLSS